MPPCNLAQGSSQLKCDDSSEQIAREQVTERYLRVGCNRYSGDYHMTAEIDVKLAQLSGEDCRTI